MNKKGKRFAIKKKMEKILVIGAFDRYNYGDLLFPLVIEKQLSSYGHPFEFQYFGLVKSDLSAVGGLPTQDLQEFYKACEEGGTPVHVIIAGGEALGVTWHSLLASLSSFFQRINKHHVRISKYVNLNSIAKGYLKGRTRLPFLFTKADFKNVNSVILNSLGGSGLNDDVFQKYPVLLTKLNEVEYLAVRDQLTIENLQKQHIHAELFPDSAILMSEFYPLDVLEKNITKAVKDYVNKHKGNYIFYQINKKTTAGKEALMAGQLDQIYQEEGVELCLCPIGKALNHDDHIALEVVRKLLKSPSTYFDADNIWDIMYLIANSKAYIGTSLHGAITAMSYSVPHVGLKVEKLNAYLATWGAKGNDFAVDFDRLFTHYKVVTKIPKSDYERSRQLQLVEIRSAFDKMKQILIK
jgi:hypothetical protein